MTGSDAARNLGHRVRESAAARGIDAARLRRQLVFQRILARLAPTGLWVLKGGYCLEVRLDTQARATRDLDLALLSSVVSTVLDVQDLLGAALETDVDGDGFRFDVELPVALATDEAGNRGWRATVHAALGGERFASIKLDVVARAAEIEGGTETLDVPCPLPSLTYDAVSMPAVDVAQHAAEKVHAYSRVYANDRPSTRVKDLVDLALLLDAELLDDARWAARLRHVFSVRDSSPPPPALPPPPVSWTGPYKGHGRRAVADRDRRGRSVAAGQCEVRRRDRPHHPGRRIMTSRGHKNAEPMTTQARLSSVIKESRNIMRKDAGLNGELDRLPQMAWLLFLKAFDDLEEQRAVKERGYQPAVATEFRWSSWGSDSSLTGDPLLVFVNNRLLPHLRGLQGSGKATDPKDTLARVFQDTRNRMLSGYLLRDLINQLDKVQFTNRDDIHTMAHLYESMLREMRDAAGDSGEFYTPRPLVRFMVDMIDPRPGEKVLDPAAGTGGFLVEAFEHMTADATLTPTAMRKVKDGIRGIEKKPMPYLLCQMNLLLHGIEEPNVDEANALNFGLAEMRKDGVDVVLTNPPFGGEEETLIQTHFPTKYRTAETVWLFLQAVMARLERSKSGRCAIVVPNSVLFDQGVGGRIKADLMARFNLHTVLRLPNGVFAPYTLIPSNVLFFEKGKQEPHIWFYEHPMPEGRKNYTKTKPLRYEEFEECATWWGGSTRSGRVENEHAWKVEAASVRAAGCNLDLRSPNRADDLVHRAPAGLVAELIEVEQQILDLLRQLQVDVEAFTI